MQVCLINSVQFSSVQSLADLLLGFLGEVGRGKRGKKREEKDRKKKKKKRKRVSCSLGYGKSLR